jgi:rhodanese-related sulfurtransferase
MIERRISVISQKRGSGITATNDFVWVATILALAFTLGAAQHWPLVQASFKGQLTTYLQQRRDERRAVQFKEIKTLNLNEAYAVWQQGGTLIIDARHAQDYQELHVPGALNLPPESWENLKDSPKLAGLDHGRQMMIYCSQESCDDALKLAVKLKALGFTRVLAFTGGFRAWDEAGYPADTGS